jgi:hypothetical protein
MIRAEMPRVQTSTRPHVKYEIEQSVAQRKGLLGIRIHKLRDQNQRTDNWGPSPTAYNYPIYDWVDQLGYKNIGDWVESAAKKVGR